MKNTNNDRNGRQVLNIQQDDAFATSQGSSSQLTPKLQKVKIADVKENDSNVDVYMIEANSYLKSKTFMFLIYSI